MKKEKKFHVVSLGCFRNTYDSECLAREFIEKGYYLCPAPDKAGLLVINTCGFIKDAKEESLSAIEEALELKRRKKVKRVYVRGCLVKRYEKELAAAFPGVDDWQGVMDLSRCGAGRVNIKPGHIDFIKISEGCSNNCAYCAIPFIKGPLKSRRADDILAEVESLDRQGVKELNVIGQDITVWGRDIYRDKNLAWLVSKVAASVKNIAWIRLLYTHPRNFTDELLEVMAREPKICDYIDLPVQHINDRILKLMGRGIGGKQIESLIKKIRKRIPGCVIRTSLIVGFPGETEAEFKELLDFINRIKFDRLGVFTYSREENTPAYKFTPQVHYKVKQRRYNELMSAQKNISMDINRKYLGQKLEVLIEEKLAGGLFAGRGRQSCYDIDGLVYVKKRSSRLKPGDFYKTSITDCYEYDLVGE